MTRRHCRGSGGQETAVARRTASLGQRLRGARQRVAVRRCGAPRGWGAGAADGDPPSLGASQGLRLLRLPGLPRSCGCAVPVGDSDERGCQARGFSTGCSRTRCSWSGASSRALSLLVVSRDTGLELCASWAHQFETLLARCRHMCPVSAATRQAKPHCSVSVPRKRNDAASAGAYTCTDSPHQE